MQDTRGLIDLPWILLSGINVLLALISCRLCNLCAGFLGALTDASEEAHPFCGLTAFGFQFMERYIFVFIEFSSAICIVPCTIVLEYYGVKLRSLSP